MLTINNNSEDFENYEDNLLEQDYEEQEKIMIFNSSKQSENF